MKFKIEKYNLFLYLSVLIFCLGCKKLTQVPEPVNTITTAETFASDATANSAISGIYEDIQAGGLINNSTGFGNSLTTINLGMSADELHGFGYTPPFETNTLNSSNGSAVFWNAPFYDIYLANAAIEALPTSPGVSAPVKKQLLGEAKFFRAFCNFYLVNMFGDIPLVTTTSYHVTDTLHRSNVTAIYQEIISDLQFAQSNLSADYSVSGGQRTRVNQSGATALLARVYLYQAQWAKAEAQCTAVINNTGLYSLSGDLNSVFLANSQEAILQLQTPNRTPYATYEGGQLVPFSNPNYYLTDELLAAFEPGDKRKTAWVDSMNYSGTNYYYPYKYKVNFGIQGNVTEYYMVLRLGEQYLIRAEARAQQMELTTAIGDLNVVRERAGLPDLPTSLGQTQVLAAVAKERRIELFMEWGHRWLDLKRTGQAHAVLSTLAYKQPWLGDYQLLYPIPAGELINDPNLVQNKGY